MFSSSVFKLSEHVSRRAHIIHCEFEYKTYRNTERFARNRSKTFSYCAYDRKFNGYIITTPTIFRCENREHTHVWANDFTLMVLTPLRVYMKTHANFSKAHNRPLTEYSTWRQRLKNVFIRTWTWRKSATTWAERSTKWNSR